MRRLVAPVALLLAMTSPASAGDDDVLVTRGIELREKGNDDEALVLFKQAYAMSPAPRTRAQIALAEQALGIWVRAEADLMSALAAESDPWIVRNRDALDGALATIRRHLGSLEVRGANTTGAEVFLDGVAVGRLPAPLLRVEAGRRALEVHAKGFLPAARTIEISAGGVTRETVDLASVQAEPTQTPPASAKESSAPPLVSDPGRGQRVLGWVTTATGGVLILGAITGFLVRQSIVADYNAECPGLGRSQSTDCTSKVDASHSWQTLSIVGLVAGGAFTAGGLVLVLTSPKRSSDRGAHVTCAPGMLGVDCSGVF